ncbi:MAG: hypothetical protein OXK72_01680 [Gammaproteobacteria bacterium]|nr:hypothetical protein [Gammaproteobacteria bacterium]
MSMYIMDFILVNKPEPVTESNLPASSKQFLKSPLPGFSRLHFRYGCMGSVWIIVKKISSPATILAKAVPAALCADSFHNTLFRLTQHGGDNSMLTLLSWQLGTACRWP